MVADSERARTEAANWLILLDDSPADAEQRARFQAWLAASPQNRAAWASIARTADLLAAAERRPARFRRRPVALAVGALAAGLVLAMAPMLLQRAGADYVTGTAQIETVILTDGTTVRLGPGSALKLAYSGDARRVELVAGEALFDVVHDPARPFSVRAGAVTATDLGTRFDVTVLGTGAMVAVSQGKVQVGAAAGTFDLDPGDWVHIGEDGGAEQGGGLPEALIAGPSPHIAARNRPVAEIVDEIRRWYGGRIWVSDDGICRRRVTGVFDATDPVHALEALVGPQGARVTPITPWLLVVSPG